MLISWDPDASSPLPEFMPKPEIILLFAITYSADASRCSGVVFISKNNAQFPFGTNILSILTTVNIIPAYYSVFSLFLFKTTNQFTFFLIIIEICVNHKSLSFCK